MRHLLIHVAVLLALGGGMAFTTTTTDRCETAYERAEYRYNAGALRHTLWLQSPYDAYSGILYSVNDVADGETVEVDHVVPLRYVHGQCGCTWTSTQKAAYASDPRNVVITAARLNKQKGASLSWRPPAGVDWFESRVQSVMQRYGLDGSCIVRVN